MTDQLIIAANALRASGKLKGITVLTECNGATLVGINTIVYWETASLLPAELKLYFRIGVKALFC